MKSQKTKEHTATFWVSLSVQLALLCLILELTEFVVSLRLWLAHKGEL